MKEVELRKEEGKKFKECTHAKNAIDSRLHNLKRRESQAMRQKMSNSDCKI